MAIYYITLGIILMAFLIGVGCAMSGSVKDHPANKDPMIKDQSTHCYCPCCEQMVPSRKMPNSGKCVFCMVDDAPTMREWLKDTPKEVKPGIIKEDV